MALEVSKHVLDYVTANRFYVEIGGQIEACFSECSGLGVQIDKEVYFEGGVNDQQRVFLKQTKFTDVTLKRGITGDTIFWQWLRQTLDKASKKRLGVDIILFNQAGEEMQRWSLIGAVPVGWKAPSLQANGNSLAIEELTLAYEGLTVTPKKGSSKVEINGEERGGRGRGEGKKEYDVKKEYYNSFFGSNRS
jgi:phage tail-like protein